MTRLAMSDLGGEYARIFGAQPKERAPGRSRRCKHCGDWHRLDAWPHNCRDERPARNHDLASPQLAPKFEEFITGKTETAEYIGDRKAKREFMDRHDLVEYDEGVAPPREPTHKEWLEDFVQDFKRAQQEDPLNRPPIDRIGETDLGEAEEVDPTDIEVFK
jgi:hypothetical protein